MFRISPSRSTESVESWLRCTANARTVSGSYVGLTGQRTIARRSPTQQLRLRARPRAKGHALHPGSRGEEVRPLEGVPDAVPAVPGLAELEVDVAVGIDLRLRHGVEAALALGDRHRDRLTDRRAPITQRAFQLVLRMARGADAGGAVEIERPDHLDVHGSAQRRGAVPRVRAGDERVDAGVGELDVLGPVRVEDLRVLVTGRGP